MKIDRQKFLSLARKLGADVAGIAPVEALVETGAVLREPLQDARSAIVVGVRQSVAALGSNVIQMAQHDTIYAYGKAHEVSHMLVRRLEDEGHAALAVPAFLPIDMSDDIKGMLGEVDHRRAAVLAGIGVYGLNNLVVTQKFGPRIRFATVLTTAAIPPNRPLRKKICTECGTCVEACPASALNECGRTDRGACGRTVFEYGLRGLMRFGFKWKDTESEGRETLLKSRNLRELWHNFMTGMYYTCFACQAACPVGTKQSK